MMFSKEKRFDVVYTQGSMLSVLVDKETGVNYLFYNGGLTPILDSSGKVVVTKE